MEIEPMTPEEEEKIIQGQGRWDLTDSLSGFRKQWTEQLFNKDFDIPNSSEELTDYQFGDNSNVAGCKQVGGSHYLNHDTQPWDIIDEYELDFYEGNVLKYLLRTKGDRLEDLEKALHYLEKKIGDMNNG